MSDKNIGKLYVEIRKLQGEDGNIEGSTIELVPEIRQVLDEAKADFPLKLSYVSDELAFPSISQKGNLKQLSDIALWFEKWFGKP